MRQRWVNLLFSGFSPLISFFFSIGDDDRDAGIADGTHHIRIRAEIGHNRIHQAQRADTVIGATAQLGRVAEHHHSRRSIQKFALTRCFGRVPLGNAIGDIKGSRSDERHIPKQHLQRFGCQTTIGRQQLRAHSSAEQLYRHRSLGDEAGCNLDGIGNDMQ